MSVAYRQYIALMISRHSSPCPMVSERTPALQRWKDNVVRLLICKHGGRRCPAAGLCVGVTCSQLRAEGFCSCSGMCWGQSQNQRGKNISSIPAELRYRGAAVIGVSPSRFVFFCGLCVKGIESPAFGELYMLHAMSTPPAVLRHDCNLCCYPPSLLAHRCVLR